MCGAAGRPEKGQAIRSNTHKRRWMSRNHQSRSDEAETRPIRPVPGRTRGHSPTKDYRVKWSQSGPWDRVSGDSTGLQASEMRSLLQERLCSHAKALHRRLARPWRLAGSSSVTQPSPWLLLGRGNETRHSTKGDGPMVRRSRGRREDRDRLGQHNSWLKCPPQFMATMSLGTAELSRRDLCAWFSYAGYRIGYILLGPQAMALSFCCWDAGSLGRGCGWTAGMWGLSQPAFLCRPADAKCLSVRAKAALLSRRWLAMVTMVELGRLGRGRGTGQTAKAESRGRAGSRQLKVDTRGETSRHHIVGGT